MAFIREMYSDFQSDVFAKPKDDSFHSSINQIAQTFDGQELYPSIQEKAANLLYYIVKNHSFVDGNKRIAAACFIYFLDKNKALINDKHETIISNEALASLTLFIATSKSEEDDIVKRFIISILNRNMIQTQSVASARSATIPMVKNKL
jgi:death-on-curing family protein